MIADYRGQFICKNIIFVLNIFIIKTSEFAVNNDVKWIMKNVHY